MRSELLLPGFPCCIRLSDFDAELHKSFSTKTIIFSPTQKKKMKKCLRSFHLSKKKNFFLQLRERERRKKTFSKDKNEEGLKQRNCFFEKRKREEKIEQHVLRKRKKGFHPSEAIEA